MRVGNNAGNNSNNSEGINFQVSVILGNFVSSKSNKRIVFLIHIQKLRHSLAHQIIKLQLSFISLRSIQIVHHFLRQQNTPSLQYQQRSHQTSRVCVYHYLPKLLIFPLYHRNIHELFNQPLSPQQPHPIHQIFTIRVAHKTTVDYHPMPSSLRQVSLYYPQIFVLKTPARSSNACRQRQILNEPTPFTVRRIARTNHAPMRPQQSPRPRNLPRLLKLRIETSDHTNSRNVADPAELLTDPLPFNMITLNYPVPSSNSIMQSVRNNPASCLHQMPNFHHPMVLSVLLCSLLYQHLVQLLPQLTVKHLETVLEQQLQQRTRAFHPFVPVIVPIVQLSRVVNPLNQLLHHQSQVLRLGQHIVHSYPNMRKENVAKLVLNFVSWVPLLPRLIGLLPQLSTQITNCLLRSIHIPLVTVLQTQHQILLQLIITVHQLEHLLVTLHPESLEQHKHRYQLSKTTRTDVNPTILHQHLTHRLSVYSIRYHPRHHRVQLLVTLHQNTVLNHLLLNQNHLLRTVYHKITLRIVRTLLQLTQLLFTSTPQMASTTPNHYRHTPNLHILAVLLPITHHIEITKVHAKSHQKIQNVSSVRQIRRTRLVRVQLTRPRIIIVVALKCRLLHSDPRVLQPKRWN